MHSESKESASSKDDLVLLDRYRSVRRPSVEELEGAAERLRITFQSLPEPRAGYSPPQLSLRFPRYGYGSLDDDDASPPPSANKAEQQRSKGGTNSLLLTASNVCSYFVGVGLLALPWAMEKVGLCGVVLLLLFGYMAALSGNLLTKCQTSRYVMSYVEIADKAFGLPGRLVVAFFFHLHLLLDLALFLHLFSTALKELLLSLFNVHVEPRHIAYVPTCLAVIATNLDFFHTKRLEALLAILSTLSTIILTSLLLWMTLTQVITIEKTDGTSTDEQQHQQQQQQQQRYFIKFNFQPTIVFAHTPTFDRAKSFFEALGVFSFSFLGHSALPSILRGMKQPRAFASLLNKTFVLITIMYVLIACLGYAAYDALNEQGGNVILNVRLASDTRLVNLLLVTTSVLVCSKYILASQPLVDGINAVVSLHVNSIYNYIWLSHGSIEHAQLHQLHQHQLHQHHHHQQKQQKQKRNFHSFSHTYTRTQNTTSPIELLAQSPLQPLQHQQAPLDDTETETLFRKYSIARRNVAAFLSVLLRSLVPFIALAIARASRDFVRLVGLIGTCGLLLSFVFPLLFFTRLFDHTLSLCSKLVLHVICGIVGTLFVLSLFTTLVLD